MHLTLEVNALEPRKADVTELIKAAVQSHQLPSTTCPEELQAPVAQMVYLCTISRVLPAALEMSNLRDIRRVHGKRDTVLKTLMCVFKKVFLGMSPLWFRNFGSFFLGSKSFFGMLCRCRQMSREDIGTCVRLAFDDPTS